ncbi:MAG: tRNA-(ms[2]io[6]A)-hydroxylase [Deltaproteobacteria bacterium]|nr:tRNA-(ms[2]io[6]A)-hydroxylase [Deltaproteobacteria bacterium]MCB9786497.1 tRNA-(ms[2]io[6]A)-hydroxylase [Deltaproteobacteria bacterium]
MRNPKSPRDPAWLARASEDTDALLQDHAHCERKAAATAMALVARHPDQPALVQAMVELAREELAHFEEVHRQILARGGVLGPDPGDPYAQALVGQVRGAPRERLVDRLLVSALIEARSCERLRLLGTGHPDEVLREMWMRFARSEARHGEVFLTLARELGASRDAVDRRMAELQAFEVRLVDESPVRCAIH